VTTTSESSHTHYTWSSTHLICHYITSAVETALLNNLQKSQSRDTDCSLCFLHCGHCLHIQKWCYLYIVFHLNDWTYLTSVEVFNAYLSLVTINVADILVVLTLFIHIGRNWHVWYPYLFAIHFHYHLPLVGTVSLKTEGLIISSWCVVVLWTGSLQHWMCAEQS
jgi:hypothetical protein